MLLYTFTHSLLQRIFLGAFLGALFLFIPSFTYAQTEPQWYNKTEWTFSWGERALASAVAVDIVTERGEEPFTVFKPPVKSVTFENGELQEGVQYFILQFKEDDEWGEIFEQELRIDTTPPQMDVWVEYTEEGMPHVFAEGEDTLSGVTKYVITIGTESIVLMPDEGISGHMLSTLSAGEHEVLVIGYDAAGNTSAQRIIVRVGNEFSLGAFLENLREYLRDHKAEVNLVVIVFLSLMAIFGVSFGVLEHRAHMRARAEARREVLSMQNKISKVFSTLRREVLLLTTLTSKKSRVTKKEKEAVEKVTKALSASEEIIEKP